MYDKIRCSTGWTAIFAAFGYGIWAWISASDGPDGIEIPIGVSVLAMTAIILLALTSIVMRLAERIERRVVDALVSAIEHKVKVNEKHLREVIKTEVAAAVEEISSRMFRAAVVAQATQAAAAATADVDASVTPMPRSYGRR